MCWLKEAGAFGMLNQPLPETTAMTVPNLPLPDRCLDSDPAGIGFHLLDALAAKAARAEFDDHVRSSSAELAIRPRPISSDNAIRVMPSLKV